MDRHLHKKYVPTCIRHAGLPDQYMWPQKDTTSYMCHNGISHPIYDCKGWINYTLPLEMYPPVGEVHPQIAMVRRPHLQYRPSEYLVSNPAEDPSLGSSYSYRRECPDARPEGFYMQSCPQRGFILASQKTVPGKLPDPNGYATGRSACNSCQMY